MRHEIKVNRNDLAKGLENLRKLVKKPKPNMDAVFSYKDGVLEVYLNGITIQASAEGSLPGLTRIPGIQALNLSKALPVGDPLNIALEDGRLFIGNFSIPCHWHDVRPNPIELPMNAPLTTLLGLRLKYSEEDIFTSGLSKPIDEAETNRRMLIRRAANALEPLGVQLSDVERLVDEKIKELNNL